MMQNLMFPKYCFDSSAFIDLWDEEHGNYSYNLFPAVWERVNKLAKSDGVISSIEVYNEIKGTNNLLFKKWLKEHKPIFLEVGSTQVETIKEIVTKYPLLINKAKNTADPCVVALAKSIGATVVTLEKYGDTPSVKSPKIPHLCEEHKVSWLSLRGFCAKESVGTS